MTDTHPSNGPVTAGALAELWQSGGDIDVGPLVKRLQRQNKRLRQLNQLSFVVCILALVFLTALEFSDQIPTRGLLSLLGALSVGYSWWKYRRDKARLIAAYSEEPARLLPFLIKRTRAMRNLGRYYYLCPIPSFLLGIVTARFLNFERASGEPGALFYAVLTIGIAALIALTVWGLRIARSRSAELRELKALHASLLKEAAA